ncbi:MAG: magnesium transporter CorA family protein [Burkholderiaceae bacterium]|nr:magnesium transporter CorA family protein [Burkholderiaceae bacterium]
MRVILFGEHCRALETLPPQWPDEAAGRAFLWVAVEREAFRAETARIQAALQAWTGGQLVDLHVSDLLNVHLPSHFDYTSWYDLLVFRRLAPAAELPGEPAVRGPQPWLRAIDTSPVGFAVFDRVLLTVHPAGCPAVEFMASRLLQWPAGGRRPDSPADLMLRLVNHLVDGYLELRRQLTQQLSQLQQELLGPRRRRVDWQALLESRNALNALEDVCEDQRSAVQEWLDALGEWPPEADVHAARERELLRLRSRDVHEHIERVLGHVRRLQASAESALQMHFSAVAQRTNDVMRTLTVLTAIFLPLNLVTGFFGMNFDSLPLIHTSTGVWVAVAVMLLLGGSLGWFFWRRRYLSSRLG